MYSPFFPIGFLHLISFSIEVGHYDVRSGHVIYINDSSIFGPATSDPPEFMPVDRALDIPLRFFVRSTTPLVDAQTGISDLLNTMEVLTSGYSALFGPELGLAASYDEPRLRINEPGGVPVYLDGINRYGCEEYAQQFTDVVLVTHRGECTFLEKLLRAKEAGAAGVLVISDDDLPLNPTADAADLEAAGDLGDVGLIVLTPETGKLVYDLLWSTAERGGQVMVQLTSPPQPDSAEISPKPEGQGVPPPRVLYLNGHPLLNTRLLI